MVTTTEIVADVIFWPEDGAFISKLVEMANEKFGDFFSEVNCEIQVSASGRPNGHCLIRCVVNSERGEQRLECVSSDLDQDELDDFREQLAHHTTIPPQSTTAQDTPKVIIRKKMNGLLDSHQAAQKLECSQIFMKENIPCSDYSYNVVNGTKQIKEYYWSKDLVDRLCHIISHGASEEDMKYIAEKCCNGDSKWAREILDLIGQPIRSGFKLKPYPKAKKDESLPGIKKRPSEFTKTFYHRSLDGVRRGL